LKGTASLAKRFSIARKDVKETTGQWPKMKGRTAKRDRNVNRTLRMMQE